MDIYDYTTTGGKNLIMEYIENLPDTLKAEVLDKAVIQKTLGD